MYFKQGKNGTRRAALGSTAVASVALLALAGCSSNGTKSASVAAGSSMSASAVSPSSASGSSVSMSDPSAVLGQWVKDVIGQHYQDACLLSALPPGGVPTNQAQASAEASAAPVAATSSSCSADLTKSSPLGESMQDELSQLRVGFVPTGSTGEATVNVAKLAPTGNSVTINARQITVDGQRLDEIVVAHSTGVTDSQVDLSFPMVKIGGAWYVGSFNLTIG